MALKANEGDGPRPMAGDRILINDVDQAVIRKAVLVEDNKWECTVQGSDETVTVSYDPGKNAFVPADGGSKRRAKAAVAVEG